MSFAVSETASIFCKRALQLSKRSSWSVPILNQKDGVSRLFASFTCHRRQMKAPLLAITNPYNSRSIQPSSSCATSTFHSSSSKFARQPSRRIDGPASQKPAMGRGPRRFIPSIKRPELVQIFGCDVSETEGNTIIRTLHSRRLDGSLVDRGVQLDGQSAVPTEGLMKALCWLRDRYPVDERGAAEEWAQKETAKIQQTYIARAEKLGLYKPLDNAEATHDTGTISSQSGQSAIEEFKLYHERRRAKEQAEKAASGEVQQQQELALAKQAQKAEIEQKRYERRTAIKAAQQERGRVTQATEIHQMTTAQRLLPSTLFASLLLLSYYFVAELYTPPPTGERLFPNYPPSVATTAGIFALNAVIFVCWKRPGLWKALNTWFTVSPSYPFALSMIGNVFSHRTFMHLAANMAGMFFYGIPLHEDIGRGNWLALYLAGGVFGSICSLWVYVLLGRLSYYHNGASGAVWAVMAAWAYITSFKPQKETDSWGFVFDVTRWAALAFQVLSHFSSGVLARIDVASHVGGALLGVFGGWAFKKQAESRRLELEREESNAPSSSSSASKSV